MVELLLCDVILLNRMEEKNGFWWLNLLIIMWCLFVDEVKGVGGKILVYCYVGVSWLVIICIVYVMYSCYVLLDIVFEFVKFCCSEILFNVGFMY